MKVFDYACNPVSNSKAIASGIQRLYARVFAPGNALLAALLLLSALFVTASGAEVLRDPNRIPHASERARESYREFLAAAPNRAFVIAPGGSWAWRADLPSAEDALEAALNDCRQHTRQRCVPYALNERVVFDAAKWPTLWGPYLPRRQAERAAIGTHVGERFPDLALRAPDGRAVSLSELRGSVVVLHFWGSWCRPCQGEMPDLQRLHDKLARDSDIRFVLIPVRESFSQARQWAQKLGVRMPIYDPGIAGEGDDKLTLGGGGKIADRELARVFPTTHVLDRHGIVVFSHLGAASRWVEYLPFLNDAAAKSGR
jgi:thiol-disulfide isomerase/thioredoxin